jgi:hypothetical protein
MVFIGGVIAVTRQHSRGYGAGGRGCTSTVSVRSGPWAGFFDQCIMVTRVGARSDGHGAA